MWISELFHSLQGEGKYTGVESVFVRTSGCNLRCWFCDTPYTSWHPEGEAMPVEEVRDRVLEWNCEHVVITGGEPFLQKDLLSLAAELHQRDKLITMETAGTVFEPIQAHLISLSPKMSNSTPHQTDWAERHEERRERLDVVRQFLDNYDCQFKFVVDVPEDLEEIDDYLHRLGDTGDAPLFLMPQGITPEALEQKLPWLQTAAAERNMQVTPRLHIQLWGNVRGK